MNTLPLLSKVYEKVIYNQLSHYSESFLNIFLKLGFTPCKSEKPLRGIELQEKEAQKRL